MYLARKYLLGTLFLRLLLEMGPPFYVVIRATRRSSCWQGKCSTLISQLFFRPWVLVRPQGSNSRPRALQSNALPTLWTSPTGCLLQLWPKHRSSGLSQPIEEGITRLTNLRLVREKRSALIRVKFLSFGVSWERHLYGDLMVTSSWPLSPIPNLRLRQCDFCSVLWRFWRNF